MEINLEIVQENYIAVMEKISKAAVLVGRKPDAIKLVVVTKALPVEFAKLAILAGANHLGENYPEEGAKKITGINSPDVAWHMIGHIQSRKAKIVAEHYDMVHSVDSLKLANILNAECTKRNKIMPILLELNVGGEESKRGWFVSEIGEVEKVFEEFEAIVNLSALKIQGLMTMPPLHDEAERSRKYFKKIRVIQDILNHRFNNIFVELSMGTSNDYEIAVEEGATYVRVGRSILGPRPGKKDQTA